MATGSTTLTASPRVFSSIFSVMESNYWSRLSDAERTMCFGDPSQLIYEGKTAWNIAGCLEQYWTKDLSAKVAEICNDPNNVRKIYRRHRHRVNVVTDMYLCGYAEKKTEASPAIFVISANGTIARRIASLLSCHESLRLPGFEILHHEVKVNLLARDVNRRAQTHTVFAESLVLSESMSRESRRRQESREFTHYEPNIHRDQMSANISSSDEESHHLPRLYENLSNRSARMSAYDLSSDEEPGLNPRHHAAFQPYRSILSDGGHVPLDASRSRHNQESLASSRSSNALEAKSFCGSRVITSALPVNSSSKWHQCTIGGVINLGGRSYGMTVAHPFFEEKTLSSSDNDTTSLSSSDTGRDEGCEGDSQSEREDTLHTTASISQSPYGIFLEDFGTLTQKQRFPPMPPFPRLETTTTLSQIGTFYAGKPIVAENWSSELDWALLDISDRRFTIHNRISTIDGDITPSSLKKKQDLKKAKVIVAGGVSDIVYTQIQSTVAQIALPWSNKMQEVWKIECICAPGDCGAWVVCPETGAIYGIVVAASPALCLTYILPAELVFESIMARWDVDASRIQEIFSMPPSTMERFDSEWEEEGGKVQGTRFGTTYGVLKAPSSAQTSSRHPRVTAAMLAADSTTRSAQICLSQLAHSFTRFTPVDFESCRKFIQEQPAILKEDERHFRCQAALAYNAGDKQHARACVHRSLMISKCSKLDAGELEEYLRYLNGESKSAIKHFMNDLDGAYDNMKANLDLLIAAGLKLIEQVTPRTQTVQQIPADEHPSASTRRQSSYSRHRASHSDAQESFRSLNTAAGADNRSQAPVVTGPYQVRLRHDPVDPPLHEKWNARSQQASGRDSPPSLDSGPNYDLARGDSSRITHSEWGSNPMSSGPTHQGGRSATRTISAGYPPPESLPRQTSGRGRTSDDLSLHADSRQEPSNLTPLGQRFAQIRVGQFKECVTFIVSNREVLKEDPLHYLREAGVLCRKSKTQDARSCVQQALIIDHCSDLNTDGIREYLTNLAAPQKSTVNKLFSDVDKTFTVVKANSDASALSEHGNQHATASERSRHIFAEHQTLSVGYQTQPSPSPNTSDFAERFSSLNVTTNQISASPRTMASEPARRHRPRSMNRSRASHSSAGQRSSSDSSQTEDIAIRGTVGEFEPLDPRYRQRRDAAEYFIVGRLFAILWHENMGITNRKPGPDVKFTRDNRFGEKIFSHIRRMIVVRQRYGYCWCVAINTYGGKGLAGKNPSDAKVQSHTVVHESTARPFTFQEEQGLMNKEPIAIKMVQGHTLDKASRLNYAKVSTVEHNVKVMDIGMVSTASMPYFQAHWRYEMDH